ncbi:MAG: 4-hydroxybenzoate octaprenyltransferase [Bacteroidetes bacterium]|nr:4-hydroxybenzoate octaprenyltransferase [Bacteroidota bacterium]
MNALKRYLSLIKFSHTIFAMPFALVGFGLGVVDQAMLSSALSTEQWWWKAVFVLGCMVFARSAAMAFNRYLDRTFDALNPRTAMREIPAGIISPKKALRFTILSAALFVGCAYCINAPCFYLSPVALLIVLGYSYTKRFTALCHLILGLGLSLSVTGAYLAVTGTFDLLPILFSLAVLTWVSGFDIIYALQDESFDRSHRLRSIPAWLGGKRALRVSSALHFLTISALFFAGIWGDYGIWYWTGTLVFSLLLIYQHALVTAEDLSRINLAFMTTNGVGSVVFSCFVIIELIFSS